MVKSFWIARKRVVAAEHRTAHGRERETAAVTAVAEIRERRRLRKDAEPAKRIALFIGPQYEAGIDALLTPW